MPCDVLLFWCWVFTVSWLTLLVWGSFARRLQLQWRLMRNVIVRRIDCNIFFCAVTFSNCLMSIVLEWNDTLQAKLVSRGKAVTVSQSIMRPMKLYGSISANVRWQIQPLSAGFCMSELHLGVVGWNELAICGNKEILCEGEMGCLWGFTISVDSCTWERLGGLWKTEELICVWVFFHWRNVNLKSHADEFPHVYSWLVWFATAGIPPPPFFLLQVSSDHIVTAQSEISLFL